MVEARKLTAADGTVALQLRTPALGLRPVAHWASCHHVSRHCLQFMQYIPYFPLRHSATTHGLSQHISHLPIR